MLANKRAAKQVNPSWIPVIPSIISHHLGNRQHIVLPTALCIHRDYSGVIRLQGTASLFLLILLLRFNNGLQRPREEWFFFSPQYFIINLKFACVSSDVVWLSVAFLWHSTMNNVTNITCYSNINIWWLIDFCFMMYHQISEYEK